MNWNQGQGNWFKLGRESFPSLETWKTLSSVRGASRSGAITKVDDAVQDAAQKALTPDMLTCQLAAFNLFLACDAMLRCIGAFDLQAKQRREAVTELKSRAKRANDYYVAAVPVVQAILSRPTDIFQLRAQGASVQLVVDRLFQNFITYARQHWQYVAKSNFGGDDLLAGRVTSVPCGGIAFAFRNILLAVVPSPRPTMARINTCFLTRHTCVCFDPLVQGNVRTRSGVYSGSCIFSEHHFIQWGGLYFDPCMTSVYTTERGLVAENLVGIPRCSNLQVLVKSGPTRNDHLYLCDENTKPKGFGGSWMMVKISDVTSAAALQNLVDAPLKNVYTPSSTVSRAIADFCASV